MSKSMTIPTEEVKQRLQQALLLDVAAIGYWLGYLEAKGKVDHTAPEMGFYEALHEVIALAGEFQKSSRYDEHGRWNGCIGNYYTEIDAFAEKRVMEIFGIEEASDKVDDVVLEIRWSREDLIQALQKRGVKPEPEHLETLANNLNGLEEISVSYGWDALDDIVTNLQGEGRLPQPFDAVIIVCPLGTKPDPEQLAIIEDYFPSSEELLDFEIEGEMTLVAGTMREELHDTIKAE